jgi:carbon-monoxide dehydrogenase large subunit
VVWPGAPDNICAEMRHGDAAATEAAFARAAHRVSLEIVNQRLAPARWSRAASLAYVDGGRLTVRLSSQMPTARARRAWPPRCPACTADNVRVLVGDVGGGFGMKTGLYPEDIVVAHAARTLAGR